jgi:glycosyltransferase involved in cell wall biosynthesis
MLVILYVRLGPYHVARVRAAAAHTPVTVVELSGAATDYAWDPVETPGLERVTLAPGKRHLDLSPATLRARVARALRTHAPDAVALPGWSDPAALAALAWCRRHGVPTVVMSESTAHDAARAWWREGLKRRVVAQFGAGLVGGRPHVAYLRTLGLPPARIRMGYDVVDNRHFADGADAARAHAEALRRTMGLPARYWLASCRFIPKKNLPRLLDAYAAYRRARPDDARDVVLLGDGPLRAEVEQRRDALGLAGCVHLPGFQQYDALPAYYGLADGFVHASTVEQWGLVVNEAMAAGLPVAVSARCGCAPDLVAEGHNGVTFDPFDTDAITNALVRLHDADAAALGAASRARIARWTPERFGTNLLAAARLARHAPLPPPSWADRLLLRALQRR